ncbi:MAG: hypothetical protein ACREMA_00455, partial [Longimicrobiales bacterium]
MKGLGAIAGRNERIQVALPLLCGYAMVAVLTLSVERDAALRAFVGNMALMAAALLAALTFAWRSRAVASGKLPWRCFALAGLLVLGSRALSLMAVSDGASRWLMAFAVLALAAGMALKLHERERIPATEAWLEALLVLCVSLAVALRAWPQIPMGEAPAAALATSIFLIAALGFSLLRVVNGENISNRILAAGIVSLAVAILPTTLAGRECCDSSSPASLAAVGGWLLLGFAALEHDASLPSRRAWHSRHLIAPLSALALALLLIQAG